MTTRVVNIRLQQWFPHDSRYVYIAHADLWRGLKASPWRNIFASHYPDGTGDPPEIMERYWYWLVGERPDLLEVVGDLRDKTLYCHCAPRDAVTAADLPWVCHGQVLAHLADAPPER